jgi:NRAMP (natural resistance-associated macrophage protein)-like metal ion transporter
MVGRGYATLTAGARQNPIRTRWLRSTITPSDRRADGYFKRLGPGLVTGAADDDPSGIGTYSQVGAAFGFALVWATIVVLPMAAAVQEMAARLGLVTGHGLGTLIRTRFPRWVLLGSVALVAIANTFNIAADLAAMGASAHLVIPLPSAALTVGMAATMLVLEIFVSYHRYARILRYLAVLRRTWWCSSR